MAKGSERTILASFVSFYTAPVSCRLCWPEIMWYRYIEPLCLNYLQLVMPDKEPNCALLRTGDLSSRDSITARRRITMLHGVTADDDRRLSGSEKNQTEGGNKEKRHLAVAPQGASKPTRVLLCFSPLWLCESFGKNRLI